MGEGKEHDGDDGGEFPSFGAVVLGDVLTELIAELLSGARQFGAFAFEIGGAGLSVALEGLPFRS